MSKDKMTIHRALAELKLIDSRIEKAIVTIEATGIIQQGGLVNEIAAEADFIKNAKAKLQSAEALMIRKAAIKSAIVQSNSQTEVIIDEVTFTVADAINYKSLIEFRKQLILTLNSNYIDSMIKFTRINEQVRTVALDNARTMIGKQGDDRVKPTDKDVAAIYDPFVKRMSAKLVDPLDVKSLTEQLQDEVDEFEAEIDAVLSESNSVTFIEI